MVDFINTTNKFLINSYHSISVPSKPPDIIWAGRTVIGSVGPVKEGEKVDITCEASGGHPPPSVTWWRDNEQLTTHQGTGPGDATLVWAVVSVVASRSLSSVPLECRVDSSKYVDSPLIATPVYLNVTCEYISIFVLNRFVMA